MESALSSENIECPHCLVTINIRWESSALEQQLSGHGPLGWHAVNTQCPSCHKQIIRIEMRVVDELDKARKATEYPGGGVVRTKVVVDRLVYPARRNRLAIESGSIRQDLKDDYLEACNVLEISAKASAVLSRRVLQLVLKEQGYDHRNLKVQIKKVLAEQGEKALPTSIKESIEFVRRFGNFSAHPISAHPITEETTLQIVNVEPDEAEWCLRIIEELFTHYYVEPDRRKKLIDDAEKKLTKS